MRVPACTLLLACCVPAAHAQTQLFAQHGDAVGDGFGASTRSAGDVDGDGHDDWIAGAPAAGTAGGKNAGTAGVFSGATNSVLHSFQGIRAFDRFGMSVDGAGDVDADGHADLVVGAPGDFVVGQVPGSVSVFSGRDGSLLHLFSGDGPEDRFGAAVRGVGDLDGDGRADVIVGAPQAAAGAAGRPGIARVFSGSGGGVLFTVTGRNDGDQLGFSVCGAGDVDGDGVQDFAVGAPREVHGGQMLGSVRVFSGATGLELWVEYGRFANGSFGHALSSMPDVTGDGRPELVVGAPREYYEHGVVRVLSGASGTELYFIRGRSRGGLMSASVGGLDDWDGDGSGDFVVGAGRDYANGIVAGFISVFSGADGTPLFEQEGEEGSYFGASVDGVGDTNGDGLSEIVVGSYRANANRGSAFVFTPVDCVPPSSFCGTQPNSAGAGARIAADGPASVVAGELRVAVVGGPPNQFGLFFTGTQEVRYPAGEGVSCVGGTLYRFLQVVPLGADGAASRSLDLQLIPGGLQAGETRYFQFWYRDPSGGPAGYNFSDALTVRFCP